MKKGIDISQWQGKVDFNKVKPQVDFVILQEGYRKTIDPKFLEYVQGCKAAGIPVHGVYHFCYATSSAEAREEAKACLANVQKAGLGKDVIVFFDFEYDTVKKAKEKGVTLGKSECILFTNTFCEYVRSQGYTAGVYANMDYYKTMYDKATIDKYVFWLADYTGEPDVPCAYHQYTESGKVTGISGNVDMDYFYDDADFTSGPEDLWEKTETLMRQQVGYLEKKSNASLDSKTGNAGYANYTKYARDVNALGLMGCQGQPWCAVYQFWLCAQVFGKAKALEIMGNGFYNCNSIKAHAKSKGTWRSEPKLGALVIFRNGAHIGRVTKITSTMIYTNEGNTSAGGTNNVEANGGCVAEKSYTRNYSGIDGYVWVDYGGAEDSTKDSVGSGGSNSSTKAADTLIGQAQIHLNNYIGAGLAVDGETGPLTKKAYRKALQTALNMDRGAGLVVDGDVGTKTKAALKKVVLRQGSTGHLVTVLEIGMLLQGINPNGVECPGSFGSGLRAAVGTFQARASLVKDYEAGYNTFMALVG